MIQQLNSATKLQIQTQRSWDRKNVEITNPKSNIQIFNTQANIYTQANGRGCKMKMILLIWEHQPLLLMKQFFLLIIVWKEQTTLAYPRSIYGYYCDWHFYFGYFAFGISYRTHVLFFRVSDFPFCHNALWSHDHTSDNQGQVS